MKSVIITGIDDETHKYLRLHCFRLGVSMVYVLREGIKKLAEHERELQGKITPMIIETDGKTYKVEYVCPDCGTVWPKDTETLNVHCPTCRRKCGADSRRVELGVSGEVSDGQE